MTKAKARAPRAAPVAISIDLKDEEILALVHKIELKLENSLLAQFKSRVRRLISNYIHLSAQTAELPAFKKLEMAEKMAIGVKQIITALNLSDPATRSNLPLEEQRLLAVRTLNYEYPPEEGALYIWNLKDHLQKTIRELRKQVKPDAGKKIDAPMAGYVSDVVRLYEDYIGLPPSFSVSENVNVNHPFMRFALAIGETAAKHITLHYKAIMPSSKNHPVVSKFKAGLEPAPFRSKVMELQKCRAR